MGRRVFPGVEKKDGSERGTGLRCMEGVQTLFQCQGMDFIGPKTTCTNRQTIFHVQKGREYNTKPEQLLSSSFAIPLDTNTSIKKVSNTCLSQEVL